MGIRILTHLNPFILNLVYPHPIRISKHVISVILLEKPQHEKPQLQTTVQYYLADDVSIINLLRQLM